MYRALWRLLPGSTGLKIVELSLIVAVVIFALFAYGFPWIAQTFFVEESTVG